ncbi:expressed protein [Phakopsora pachyrhizi]|uniref:Expressed protein n=1 Tax=Phakopsora pachyrhizi TaxID=170000 RepID=A0AAV0AQN0_PHAPC|nr:expressed protein [Phakopsora pachyrhizi]
MSCEDFDPYSSNLRIADIKDFMYKMDPHVYIPRNSLTEDGFIFKNESAAPSQQRKGCASLRLQNSELKEKILEDCDKVKQKCVLPSRLSPSSKSKKRSLALYTNLGAKENPKRSRVSPSKITSPKELDLSSAPFQKKSDSKKHFKSKTAAKNSEIRPIRTQGNMTSSTKLNLKNTSSKAALGVGARGHISLSSNQQSALQQRIQPPDNLSNSTIDSQLSDDYILSEDSPEFNKENLEYNNDSRIVDNFEEGGGSQDEYDRSDEWSIESWLYEEIFLENGNESPGDEDFLDDPDVSAESIEVDHLPFNTKTSSKTQNTQLASKDIHHLSQRNHRNSTKFNVDQRDYEKKRLVQAPSISYRSKMQPENSRAAKTQVNKQACERERSNQRQPENQRLQKSQLNFRDYERENLIERKSENINPEKSQANRVDHEREILNRQQETTTSRTSSKFHSQPVSILKQTKVAHQETLNSELPLRLPSSRPFVQTQKAVSKEEPKGNQSKYSSTHPGHQQVYHLRDNPFIPRSFNHLQNLSVENQEQQHRPSFSGIGQPPASPVSGSQSGSFGQGQNQPYTANLMSNNNSDRTTQSSLIPQEQNMETLHPHFQTSTMSQAEVSTSLLSQQTSKDSSLPFLDSSVWLIIPGYGTFALVSNGSSNQIPIEARASKIMPDDIAPASIPSNEEKIPDFITSSDFETSHTAELAESAPKNSWLRLTDTVPTPDPVPLPINKMEWIPVQLTETEPPKPSHVTQENPLLTNKLAIGDKPESGLLSSNSLSFWLQNMERLLTDLVMTQPKDNKKVSTTLKKFSNPNQYNMVGTKILPKKKATNEESNGNNMVSSDSAQKDSVLPFTFNCGTSTELSNFGKARKISNHPKHFKSFLTLNPKLEKKDESAAATNSLSAAMSIRDPILEVEVKNPTDFFPDTSAKTNKHPCLEEFLQKDKDNNSATPSAPIKKEHSQEVVALNFSNSLPGTLAQLKKDQSPGTDAIRLNNSSSSNTFVEITGKPSHANDLNSVKKSKIEAQVATASSKNDLISIITSNKNKSRTCSSKTNDQVKKSKIDLIPSTGNRSKDFCSSISSKGEGVQQVLDEIELGVEPKSEV